MVAILLVSCGDGEPETTPVPSGPSPTQIVPKSATTPEAQPTPTPGPMLSIPEMETAVGFVVGHRTVTGNWDQFHADFDSWRQDLIACDASKLNVSLGEFAGRFVGITEAARRLPREAFIRELADIVVHAAETEEEAIRQLRDNWRPNDPAVFGQVDVQRSEASGLRRQVLDAILDLQVRTSLTSRARLGAYISAFEDLNSDWDEFQANYDTLRAREAERTSSETVLRLGGLIDDFRDITLAARNLPTTEVTRHVSQFLSEAADDVDLALRRLRGTFEKFEDDSGDAEGVPTSIEEFSPEEPELEVDEQQLADSNDATSTPEAVVSFEPRNPTLFDAFDEQLVIGNALRREAVRELAHIIADTSEENEEFVQEFASQYDRVTQDWDSFHEDYDVWRATEGGCDRAEAIQTLGEFAARFDSLTDAVRALPRATFLRPLGELFVVAAELEDEALRHLRNTWHPFDASVYEALDQERNEAKRLRRQVAVGVQDLIAVHEISAEVIEASSP